jgi:hypothetical protein
MLARRKGVSPPRPLFETEGSPQHRHVEPLRLRLPCFVMLDLCQQEIEPLARRPFPPGTLARREAAQGRDLLVGWRGRLPGRYVSPPNWERAGLRSAGTEVTDGAKEGVRFPP